MDEARRSQRASSSTRVIRPGDQVDEAREDADYWAALSVRERVELAWALSREQWSLHQPETPEDAHRLSRSVARVVGR